MKFNTRLGWLTSYLFRKRMVNFGYVWIWGTYNACPKDDFPVPITELLMDATTGFGSLSFMNSFPGYNQIKMDLEDEDLTTFRTPHDIYCSTVMSCGFKNTRATYQRAMAIIFHDLLHDPVELMILLWKQIIEKIILMT